MNLRSVAVVIVALAAAACDSGTGIEPGEKTAVTVNFCPGFLPSWFGIQNEGESWQEVGIGPGGNANFLATERVSLAIVFDFFSSTFTQVVNTTLSDAQGITGFPCDGAFGSRVINGTVAGLTGDQVARISAAGSPAEATAAAPGYSLTELPDAGSLDVVATRYATPFTQPPNRVFVRRGIIPNNDGTPIQPIDFASPTESGAPENATVTFDNVGTSQVQSVSTEIVTRNGTIHELMDLSGGTAPWAYAYVSLPVSLRFTGDYHRLYAVASSSITDREIYHTYTTPANKTLAFGPNVSTPAFAQVATSPYLRVRAQVPSQPEYSTAMSVDFYQVTGSFGLKTVSVVTTASFLGAQPATWDITMPDFGSSGYASEWGLTPGEGYDWIVTGLQGDLQFIIGGTPPDNALLKTGLRSGQSASVQEFRTQLPRQSTASRRRPRR